MFGFSSIGPFELLLILVVALVIFGPRKLPEIGKAVGQAIRSFREQSQKLTDELTLDTSEPPQSPKPVVPESPPPRVPPPRARKKRTT